MLPLAAALLPLALSSSLPTARPLFRLVTAQSDLADVARLQQLVFDPPEAAPSTKPSLFDGLFGAPRPRNDRAARAERLTTELSARVAKGSDIWAVVEDEAPDGAAEMIGSADLSEQEFLLPTQ